MRIFGLTGGIASGKSTVSRFFAQWGVPIVDADKVSRMVVEPNTSGYIEVVQAFGLSVVQENGELDRKALGRIVFADAEKRKLLNSIVHPRIALMTEAMFSEMKTRGEHLVCYDAPLLLENRLADTFRPVVVVTVPESVQIDRIMKRDSLTVEAACARIAAQMPQSLKVAQADIVVKNDGDLSKLEANARSALDEVFARISRRV